jgi:hypothetical protein
MIGEVMHWRADVWRPRGRPLPKFRCGRQRQGIADHCLAAPEGPVPDYTEKAHEEQR